MECMTNVTYPTVFMIVITLTCAVFKESNESFKRVCWAREGEGGCVLLLIKQPTYCVAMCMC